MVFSVEEYRSRIASAVRSLRVLGGDYIITTPSPNLIYFTGLRIESYERITALIINADGDAVLIA
ncbi:MAG: aminopeptidase P family N-terminal domain-containing protein, partial [Sulfolobales archaeon]